MTYKNIKSYKKPGLYPFSEKHIFGKPTGGSNLLPPAFLRLRPLTMFDKKVSKILAISSSFL